MVLFVSKWMFLGITVTRKSIGKNSVGACRRTYMTTPQHGKTESMPSQKGRSSLNYWCKISKECIKRFSSGLNKERHLVFNKWMSKHLTWSENTWPDAPSGVTPFMLTDFPAFWGQIRYLDEYLDDLTSIKKNLGLIQAAHFEGFLMLTVGYSWLDVVPKTKGHVYFCGSGM